MTHLIPRREDVIFPLQEQFDKLFDEFFGPRRLPSLLNSVKRSGYPKLDVLVTDGKYRVEAAVPGVPENDLLVEIVPQDSGKRLLRISGKMSHDYQYGKDTEYHFRELTRQKFQRVISLPDEVKGEPEAVIKDGLLTLTWSLPHLPPKEEVQVVPLKKG